MSAGTRETFMCAWERYCPDVARSRAGLMELALDRTDDDIEPDAPAGSGMEHLTGNQSSVPALVLGSPILVEPSHAHLDTAPAGAGFESARQERCQMPGIVIASANGIVGIEKAVATLRSGGTALDAVLDGTRLVEANPDDHTVGYSGLPNMLGEVELDASVMDGNGLRAGGVGALHGYQDAADLARHVMDELPHSLIAGPGAARFASEVGLEPRSLLTPEAEKIWRRRIDKERLDRVGRTAYFRQIKEIVARSASDADFAVDGEPPHGTVNFIARDRDGNIACAVSTSGWAWKYPGRMGDSPVIGAGNYADNRWGAAACTGRGEMAQRCCTAHSVVMFMRFGMTLERALEMAMTDLNALDDPYLSQMNIVGIDREGTPAAVSTKEGKTYVVMSEDMTEPDVRLRTIVKLDGLA